MPHSSRDTPEGAGWGNSQLGTYKSLMPARVEKLSWLNPGTLWAARNGVLASWFGDPTGRTRSRWVEQAVAAGAPPDAVVRRTDADHFSFMVIGDTGEGDDPQYAVIPGFLKVSQGTDFAVLASDVIYPVGSTDDYGKKFFRPYRNYPAPIYAIPGNHDWYEGLQGFMRVFCEAPPLASEARPRPLTRAWLRSLLWHAPGSTDEHRLAEARALRSEPSQQAVQPGPYWAVDAGPIRIIGIDTGLLGTLDAEQGRWLREVSRGDRPKILVTGSPLYVDGEHHPCAIEGGGTVDAIVRDPEHHYVAAIGGDIHNYQRYPVRVDGGRTIQYVVAGGGGAFMHATHTVPRVSVAGVTEHDFRCYPLRGDSLAFYSRLYGHRLRMPRFFTLTEAEALAVVAERLGVPPIRAQGEPVRVTRRIRLVASLLGAGRRPDRKARLRLPVRKLYTQLFSPGSATYSPPFFKCFLRLDVTPAAIRLRCHSATGTLDHEIDPPVEDEVTIPLS
ncbi:metallophosphoesterase [Streptomyces sp. MBT27]|uniref:metallophosphoesterase n=1 Tax=Streptomyces sp. MBT27 TaxID=1488356 RepID=UPI001422FCFE|nr:metallophosphoesterase [Streptomyces sp. MBT27]